MIGRQYKSYKELVIIEDKQRQTIQLYMDWQSLDNRTHSIRWKTTFIYLFIMLIVALQVVLLQQVWNSNNVQCYVTHEFRSLSLKKQKSTVPYLLDHLLVFQFLFLIHFSILFSFRRRWITKNKNKNKFKIL